MVIEYLKAIVFGIVQGATEFIPVSSSGHLVLLHQWLPSPVADSLAFGSFLHLGTFLAVVWFYRRDLSDLAKRESGPLFKGQFKGSLIWVLAVATVPAAAAGYFLEKWAETAFRAPVVVAVMMISVGVLFLWVERRAKHYRTLVEAKASDGLAIGLAQAVALIPGTSRSGIAIIAALRRGFSREAAVKFAFLLSIPIIAGASALGLKDIIQEGLGGASLIWLFLAFFSAFFSGLYAIRFLVSYLQTNTLSIFAYYRFLVAAIILLYTFVF